MICFQSFSKSSNSTIIFKCFLSSDFCWGCCIYNVSIVYTHTHAQPPINPSTRTQTNTFLMWVVLLCLCFGIGSSEMLLLFVVVIVACRQPLYTKFSSIYLTWITLKCVLLIQWQITQSAQAIDYIDNSIIQQKNHIPNVLSSIFFFSSQFLCVILLYVI